MNTSTHTYLIVTQTLENYGAHDKDGRFSSGNACWKFKGGDEYIIPGLDRIQDAVAYVAAKCSNNIGYKEFPTSWEEVSADYQTEFEKSQMEYEGDIRYPARRINVAEELGKCKDKPASTDDEDDDGVHDWEEIDEWIAPSERQESIKINTSDINFSGTGLVGYVSTTYDHLVDVLGEPHTDYEKSTAHWNIQGKDGTVATIYDYKEYMTPKGEYLWHIGGHSDAAIPLVESLIGLVPVYRDSIAWNPWGGGCDN